MKRIFFARWIAGAVVALAATTGFAMDMFDFDAAWKQVDEAARKDLPRSVTNLVARIEREAVAAERWPDAARAFLVREQAMAEFTDDLPQDWLPAFAASVDAQPAPLQAVLQLHLAHTYLENSRQWRWGGAAPTKLDDEAAAEKMPPWSPEKIAATLEAQFEKVFARSEALQGQKLADWKALFDPGTLPESFCPTLFDFAVRDAIDFYGESIPDRTLEKGLALYGRLIAFHDARGDLDALAMAELQRAEYVRAFDEKPQKERDAAFEAFLDDFLARHEGRTEAVAFGAAAKAGLLRGRGELVAAHDLAAAYAGKWPKTLGGRQCANVVAEIEAKDLSLEVERNWCAPWPEIKVRARNLDKVHFRLVPVSFEDLVADESMGEGFSYYEARSTARDKYAKRKPAKEWSAALDLEPGYRQQTFRLAVPDDLKPGHYVLFAAANAKFGTDGQPLFAEYVTVTPLALVLRTGEGAFRGSVHLAESGEPVAGAHVELWGVPKGSGRRRKLRETCETDADGTFAATVADDNGYYALRHVRVVKDGAEVLSLSGDWPGSPEREDPRYEHIDLFTDRAIYRPGQPIRVKGIAYHADPRTRDFRTKTEVTVRLTLKDPNGKEVATERLRPNKWGSFVHTFVAPVDRLTGGYTINAWYLLKDGGRGEANKVVNVEDYKRPKFEATLGKASEEATLGAPVTVTGTALTYSGLPVQGAKVAWHVERRTLYPDWCRWFGRGGGDEDDDGERFVAQGEATTDENGAFAVEFTPVAAPTADLAGDPSFRFTVSATVTDGTGEARSAESSFEIGTVAWRAGVWTDGEWPTAGRPVAAKVSLASLSGAAVPVKGTLRVFRLKGPERPARKPIGHGRWGYGAEEDGPWDWRTWEQGEEVLSLELAEEKAEPWKGALDLGAGAYRLVFETKDPNGKTVKGVGGVLVFDPAAKALGTAVPELFRVEAHTVKVGGTMRVYWGTGYETGYCRVRVYSNGKTIVDEAVRGGSPVWFYELPIADQHRGKIEIETTFVRENRLYRNESVVWVPWDNQHLDIEAEHLTSKLHPGTQETWTFKVSGPAEVLAFLYDRSLDAYRWHDVSLGFSNHFTPWTPRRAYAHLQNGMTGLVRLDGFFPSTREGLDLRWPSWRDLPSRFGRLRYKNQSRGFAVMRRAAADVEDEDVCYEMAAEDAGDAFSLTAGAVAAAPAAAPVGHGGKMARRESKAAAAEPPAEVAPRKNLQETAFFLPDLETDAEGRVSFTFTVPNALTGWKLLMVAHDNALDGGVYRNDAIVTTKPLMCEPNAPRFAREGDDFLFAVKVTNTEDEPQSGTVELALEELGGGGALAEGALPPPQAFELAPHESKTFEFRVAIPDGCGFLKYVAKAKGAKFADGEEGVLPVLARRILVREAVQLHARGAETRTFALSNLLASAGSGTIRHAGLEVRAVSRPAWYAVLSLPYLMEFPHECCEQTFSRYYANALGAFIANADPRIRATFDAWRAAGAEALKSPLETNPQLKAVALEATPWVREAEHETAARARLGELFGGERLAAEQERCLGKLRETRNRDGLWPWFPGGPSSDGITLYILTGFARLHALAKTEIPEFFADATEALDRKVAADVQRRLELERTEQVPFRVNDFDVRWLYLHSFAGVKAPKNEADAKRFREHLREEWPDLGLETQALAAIALKRHGAWLKSHSPLVRTKERCFKPGLRQGREAEELAQEILASIKERGVLSDELGMYWKRPYFFSCSLFAAPVSTQALIVEAFREVTGDEASADACNVWLLKQKQTQDWTTTAATADAIYALVLGGGADLLAGDALAEVTLGGEKVPAENAEAGTGMWSHRYAAEEIKPGMGEIAFTGAGEKGVAWGGVHWSYFEDVLKVRAHEPKELRVEKKYYRKTKGAEGTRLAALGEALEPGDEIVARLEITSDRTYEFVHLSDERPACAEPVDVLSSYRWRDGVGYYQSTKDTATHYYIDRLNKGVFVLETSYRVQQRGVFSGGLATIQCMYAPEFTAHSSAETVRVK